MLSRCCRDEREARGLLALLLVHHARRATRTDDEGRLVRARGSGPRPVGPRPIARGPPARGRRARGRPPGRFALQAAIAALHAQAPSYAETDWPQILTLYDALLRVWPSPVVALNRAVAVAMVEGPEAGAGGAGGARGRRPTGRLPLPARRPRPTCCAASGAGRGRRRVPRRAGAGRQRRGARVPRAAARRVRYATGARPGRMSSFGRSRPWSS